MAQLVVEVVSRGIDRTRTQLNGLNGAARRTQQDLRAMTGEAQFATNGINRLSMAATGLASALAVDQVIKYADSWANTTNKLVNATKAGEQLADVTQRVFDTAQASAGGLQATAQLYGRLEASTRSLLKTGDEVANIVETINKAFVVSGASAAEAAGSIVQLSQAFGAGALRGEEFNSVNEAAPRLMQALADSLGVTRGALRKLAEEGKLTSDVLVTAFQQQAAKIDAEFDKMQRTFEQKGVKAANNLAAAFGSNGPLNQGVQQLGDLMVDASENADLFINAGIALSAAYGARLVGSLASATAAKVKTAAASRATAAAELSAATAVARKTAADKAAAAAEMQKVRAAIAASNGTISATANVWRLKAAQDALATSAVTAAAAQARLAAAQQAVSVSARLAAEAASAAQGALALIGGPAGAALLAAAGIYMVYQRMQQGEEKAREYGEQIGVVSDRLRELNDIQLAAEIAKAGDFMKQAAEDRAKLQRKLNALEFQEAAVRKALASSTRENAAAEELIAQKLREQAIVRGEIQKLDDKYAAAQRLVAQANREIAKETGTASIGLQVVNDAIRGIKPATEGYTEAATKVANKLREQIALAQLSGVERAKLLAIQQAGVDLDSAEADEIGRLAEQLYKLTDATKTAAKADKDALTVQRERLRLLRETQAQIEGDIERQRKTAARASELARPGASATGYGQISSDRDSKLAELEEMRRSGELESLSAYEAAKYGIEEEAQRKLAELRQRYADKQYSAREEAVEAELQLYDAIQSASRDGMSALAANGKEASGVYKALFLAQKAAALASIIISTEEGAAKAVGQLGAFGIPTSTLIRAQGYASAALVGATAVAGFADGGPVSGPGTGRSDSIPAYLSNGEYVINAAATRRNRGMLDAINSGGTVSGGATVNVTVIDQSTNGGNSVSVRQLTERDVEIIIEDRVPGIMAREQADPYSRFSKSQRATTTTGRRF